MKNKLVTLREIRSFPVLSFEYPLRLILLFGVFITDLLNSFRLLPDRKQRLLLLLNRYCSLFHILYYQTELRTMRLPRIIDRLPSRLVLLEVVVHALYHDGVALDVLEE